MNIVLTIFAVFYLIFIVQGQKHGERRPIRKAGPDPESSSSTTAETTSSTKPKNTYTTIPKTKKTVRFKEIKTTKAAMNESFSTTKTPENVTEKRNLGKNGPDSETSSSATKKPGKTKKIKTKEDSTNQDQSTTMMPYPKYVTERVLEEFDVFMVSFIKVCQLLTRQVLYIRNNLT